jgi:uncharacterized phage-associated protein
MMADVFDVAAGIIEKTGPITAMKLQKLVFYAQAWSLVWDEKPLFGNRIEAWANGPVTPDLYAEHRGEFTITTVPRGDPTRLTKEQKDTIKAVVRDYGKKGASWLSALTHREQPWIDARKGLQDGERGSRTISHGAMADYYGNI